MVEITGDELRKLRAPNQVPGEWKEYLMFLKEYCVGHKIANPLIVEIGTQYGGQKAFYERFLDAVHIGIDISDKLSKPDILGDSHRLGTMVALKKILNSRAVNVLFLDGAHTYADTVADYWAYSPLVTDVIVFHDIRHVKEIEELWMDIQMAEKDNPNVTFLSIGAWGRGWCELGIGLMVKRNKNELLGVNNG